MIPPLLGLCPTSSILYSEVSKIKTIIPMMKSSLQQSSHKNGKYQGNNNNKASKYYNNKKEN